jgi:hypothetical protein
MKAGAVEFLTKPLHDRDVLDAIQAALRSDRARLEDDRKVAEFRTRHGSLTAREREVMALLVSGRVNKQIAAEAGISEVDGAVAPRSDHAKGARHFAGRPDPDRRQNQILMAGQGTEAKNRRKEQSRQVETKRYAGRPAYLLIKTRP